MLVGGLVLAGAAVYFVTQAKEAKADPLPPSPQPPRSVEPPVDVRECYTRIIQDPRGATTNEIRECAAKLCEANYVEQCAQLEAIIEQRNQQEIVDVCTEANAAVARVMSQMAADRCWIQDHMGEAEFAAQTAEECGDMAQANMVRSEIDNSYWDCEEGWG
jgi:hypothetical protein